MLSLKDMVVPRWVKVLRLVAFAAASYFLIAWAIGYTSHQLDVFATNRVVSHQLPISKTEVKVFVTDGKEVTEAAAAAARQGAAQGAQEQIEKYLR